MATTPTNKINTSIEDVYRSTPMGGVEGSMSSVFKGINHRQLPSAIPLNKDQYGLVFFTRPQLNMEKENLRALRPMLPLLTNEAASIPRIIRGYLDPRLGQTLKCPMVDNKNPFMPLLTNHIISCTGWPDILLDTFTSAPGNHKEVFSFVDSVSDLYAAYDINATFRNMQGNPILWLFYFWALYMAGVYKGILAPYPDFLVKNVIDYNTRIYRITLDERRKIVQDIGCTNAAFPINVPIGGQFDFEVEQPLNMNQKEIQIQFRATGVTYKDPILIEEFNDLVGIFNPAMQTKNISSMTKIPFESLSLFNNRGYPRININTRELEWYVDGDTYSRVLAAVDRHDSALNEIITSA